jgi:hypothetical protein
MFAGRICLFLTMSVALATLMAAPPPSKTIEVTAFEAAKGVDVPPDFQAALMDELVKQLTETKKFAKILRPGDAPLDPATPRLKLIGVVTNVEEGSRAARVMVGFGAGSAHMAAHVKFIDAVSGEVKFESDVRGRMWAGWGGGNALKAANSLAKNIVKLAKDKL